MGQGRRSSSSNARTRSLRALDDEYDDHNDDEGDGGYDDVRDVVVVRRSGRSWSTTSNRSDTGRKRSSNNDAQAF